MCLSTSYFSRYPDLLSLKVSIDFTFVSVNIYLWGQYAWVFTSAAVNSHSVLPYMMLVYEIEEPCGMKKMLVKDASGEINLFLFHLNTFWLFKGQVLFHLVKNGCFPLQAGVWATLTIQGNTYRSRTRGRTLRNQKDRDVSVHMLRTWS